MKSCFNSSFATLCSKHFIRCCRVQHHLHNIGSSVRTIYPCCQCERRDHCHPSSLPQQGSRKDVQKVSIQPPLMDGRHAGTSPLIIKMAGECLKARNTKTMSENCMKQGPQTNDENGCGWQLAQEHYLLERQNLFEGRVSSKYVEMQRSYYRLREKCRQSETIWAGGFIENLICIPHDQWTWRDGKLHYCRHPSEGRLPLWPHEDIFVSVQ